MDCTDNIYCANGELNVYTVHGYRIDMYPDTVFTVLFLLQQQAEYRA
jgi:hypothetical protein